MNSWIQTVGRMTPGGKNVNIYMAVESLIEDVWGTFCNRERPLRGNYGVRHAEMLEEAAAKIRERAAPTS